MDRPNRRRRRPVGRVTVGLLIVVLLAALMPDAEAAPPPSPLPWLRRYVEETPQTAGEIGFEIFGACVSAPVNGVIEGTTAGPTIAVIGDSIAAQYRLAIYDPLYHFVFAATCGERFASTLDSGRAAAALATNPSVVVLDLGYNTFLDGLQNLHPEYVQPSLPDLERLLVATDHIPCRVIVNIARQPDPLDTPEAAARRLDGIDQVNAALTAAAAGRPGVHLADWDGLTATDPSSYMIDGRHLLRRGLNTRINLLLETSRQCLVPDSPTNVMATGGDASATVTWDALPEPEKVTSYQVTASDGQSIVTSDLSATFTGLSNGTPYRFTVTATNAVGAGEPTPWSNPVTPGRQRGEITGEVRNSRGPLARMMTIVSSADQVRVAGLAISGADGTFTIPELPPGQYKLATVDVAQVIGADDHYTAEFYDNGGLTAEDFETATPITVAAGFTTPLNPIVLDYNHPGRVSGTVSDTGGGPLTGMLTLVTPADQAVSVGATLTGADGAFTIDNLLPGTYKLVTVDPALLGGATEYYIPEFYDDAGSTMDAFAGATTIEVTPGATTTLEPVLLDHTP